MSRPWENPWRMGGGSQARRHIVGWATDYPDGHAATNEMAIVREVKTGGGGMAGGSPRTGWIVTATIRCECGTKVERTGPAAWSDPRRYFRWYEDAMVMVRTLHGDHCRAHTGRRPRRMLLAGPVQTTTEGPLISG